ncbi:hypothetical protein HAX54_019501 [Datura stramonium]|uniref:Uncharacterized protein n=1 Tax=Datura stramonium TaxID=4076 RepID=A0ABS8S5D1_DATST|nr:hypothetical protein [Datura stramonium]
MNSSHTPDVPEGIALFSSRGGSSSGNNYAGGSRGGSSSSNYTGGGGGGSSSNNYTGGGRGGSSTTRSCRCLTQRLRTTTQPWEQVSYLVL